MRIMNDPVQNGVGHRRLADAVVPFCDGILTGDEGGLEAVAVLHQFQKVPAIILGKRFHCPVIYSDEFKFGKAADEFEVAAVGASDLHFSKEL